MRRGAGIQLRDFDPVKEMFESSIAAAEHHWAIARDHLRRLQLDGQPTFVVRIVVELIANAVAVFARGETEELEGDARLNALGRIWSTKRGLEEFVRDLKGVQFFARNFQDDRIAHSIRD